MDDLFDCAVVDLVLGGPAMGVSEKQDGNRPVGSGFQRGACPKSRNDEFPAKTKRRSAISKKRLSIGISIT
uniref:Uncharacterized protein n=1 Tax=Desulfatirhabdium butyrativorans TaxID=340467 RepID=A0A7C4RUG8_9BACT